MIVYINHTKDGSCIHRVLKLDFFKMIIKYLIMRALTGPVTDVCMKRRHFLKTGVSFPENSLMQETQHADVPAKGWCGKDVREENFLFC